MKKDLIFWRRLDKLLDECRKICGGDTGAKWNVIARRVQTELKKGEANGETED